MMREVECAVRQLSDVAPRLNERPPGQAVFVRLALPQKNVGNNEVLSLRLHQRAELEEDAVSGITP
jgi:hypothetical protein